MNDRNNDPTKEGHTKEWQDRARVVLDAKEDAQKDSADKQSPAPGEGQNVDSERGKVTRRENESEDPAY